MERLLARRISSAETTCRRGCERLRLSPPSSLDRFLLIRESMSAANGLGHLLPSVDAFPPSRLVRSLSKLPPATLASLFWRVAGARSIAVCLHRVHDDERREGELQPWLSIDARTLD